MTGSRPLDALKVQAPGVARAPDGRIRLFYTAIGPERPFRDCQGVILSAVSDDGLAFLPEPGIRLAPRPDEADMSLRVLAPSVVALPDGRWRLYFEARGPADMPTVIRSAVSHDQIAWELEADVRLSAGQGVGAPRCVVLPDGTGLLTCWVAGTTTGSDGRERRMHHVMSARTRDGLAFLPDPGHRLQGGATELESAGITAAEVLAPAVVGEPWTMVYSGWQDRPPGSPQPVHPSDDRDAVASGASADFAAASIAADLSGYRSRILVATSTDGVTYTRQGVVVEGDGYAGTGLDAVHAEDMSLLALPDGGHRMYYAACDTAGRWLIASAVRAL